MVSQQTPIDSPFGYRSTAADVVDGIDLNGKNVVVTGGYSGIGTETVRALAGAGAHVIVAARRPDAAQENLADMPGTITIIALDLADPASIDTFSADVASRLDALHILINNAAIMASPFEHDARGYEKQFATNHLGHFQLTARLWPLLKAADGARVVVLSSSAHARNGIDLDDVNFETRAYDRWMAYAQSKSANALFALSLDKIGEPAGIRAFAVDPGGIRTPLQRYLTIEEMQASGWIDENGTPHEMFKSTEEGASTTMFAAVSPLLDGMGGVYCEHANIAAPWQEGNMPGVGVHAHVRDEALADALWAKTEALTGITFPA